MKPVWPLYDSEQGLLAHKLYSQISLHSEYGGVVPELASRDHVRKLVPMVREVRRRRSVRRAVLMVLLIRRGLG